MQAERFIFESYDFDAATKVLKLNYSLDGTINFCETYRFDFEFVDYDNQSLDRAIQNLFLVAGVSYYKTCLPPTIEIKQAQVNAALADFLEKLYKKGLGEFFYVNNLDPWRPIIFPTTSETITLCQPTGTGQLVALGGGKDSLVSVELLRDHSNKLATWSVGHRAQLESTVKAVGLPHLWVEREWDKQLQTLNEQGAYNGHVPISAIFACVGTVVAILSGFKDIVMSNEHSANEATLEWQGMSINHQYSKSMEFELDYQTLLTRHFGESLRYYSFLRPLSEMMIAELFAAIGYGKYLGSFSSCNKAFRDDSNQLFWCGKCAKCAFVFLILTPFLQRDSVEVIFDGKNLLLDPEIEPLYLQLLGIVGEKPLECVGEIQESRIAMHRAQARYAELKHYRFELDRSYNYQTLREHRMPSEQFIILEEQIKNLI